MLKEGGRGRHSDNSESGTSLITSLPSRFCILESGGPAVLRQTHRTKMLPFALLFHGYSIYVQGVECLLKHWQVLVPALRQRLPPNN